MPLENAPSPRAMGEGTGNLAAAITRAASQQTYWTIRLLVDRRRVADAFRAYAYFRWLDDAIDQGSLAAPERIAFVERQASLLEGAYHGQLPQCLTREEQMLVDLVRGDVEPHSGLQAYLRNMMAVMVFDAGRRGRLISVAELAEYTRWLATAVTEALHFYIGHDCFSPGGRSRYLAVTAAHITHMLRDTYDDVQAGYFNVPREYLTSHRIGPQALDSEAYRAWVARRVRLARACFQAGRDHLARVESFRCRLAGRAYIARFEGVLDAIERDGCRLRRVYSRPRPPGALAQLLGAVL